MRTKEKSDRVAGSRSRNGETDRARIGGEREPVKPERGRVVDGDGNQRRIHRLLSGQRLRYVSIENACLDDERLSFRAKGLLAYLLSRSPNWVVRVKQLKSVSGDGIHSIQTALRQLEKSGYAKLARPQGDDGRFGGTVWQIFERPSLNPNKSRVSTENTENRDSVKPRLGKTAPTKYGSTTKPGTVTKPGMGRRRIRGAEISLRSNRVDSGHCQEPFTEDDLQAYCCRLGCASWSADVKQWRKSSAANNWHLQDKFGHWQPIRDWKAALRVYMDKCFRTRGLKAQQAIRGTHI